MYISDTEFDGTFKIGWTYDLEIRTKDNRTTKLINLVELFKGNPEDIILIEKLTKQKFFNEEYYKLYKSTEIFPLSLKEEIIDFINLQRLSLNGSTP